MEHFNTSFISTDRSSTQKLNKATEILNDTIEELDLTYIFMILHYLKNPECTFFLKNTWNIL